VKDMPASVTDSLDSLDAVMAARMHSVMIDWYRGASGAARKSTRQHMGA